MLKLELKLDLKLKLDRTAKPNLDGAEKEGQPRHRHRQQALVSFGRALLQELREDDDGCNVGQGVMMVQPATDGQQDNQSMVATQQQQQRRCP